MPSTGALRAPFRLDRTVVNRLVGAFGTPLYVIDENALRERARAYKSSWPAGEVSFASKANSTLGVLGAVHAEGLSIDVASEGEFEAALRAGVPPKDCRLHGNLKPRRLIERVAAAGIGRIIVDSLEEIEVLGALGVRVQLLIRIAPSVDSGTQEKISTAHSDTKFGLAVATGDAHKGVQRALELGLDLRGVHVHVGSQLAGPRAVIAAVDAIAKFLEETRFEATVVNLGGGLGITYTPDAPFPSIEEHCSELLAVAQRRLAGMELDIEPGRSIVGEAGVTVYRVGAVKRASSGTRYVVVDGGMSDNPRPALYGAHYTVESFVEGPQELATVAGSHCESDTLFKDVQLPGAIRAGDLVVVLATGAYGASMASNYNRFLRPASVLLGTDGRDHLLQRRETFDELFARESMR